MTEDVVAPGAGTALRATGLAKRYRRGWALRGCSLELPQGRIAGLVGPNGSGKSTLLKLAVGLIAPTEGEITVLGQRPGSGGAPAGVSFLSQERPLYASFRVGEVLRAGAALNSGRGARWDAGYVRGLVEQAEVPLDARVSALSGGQRTRVALALALGRRPELLLLDEPLADLDPLARRQVMGTLLAEAGETGLTVLLSSHVIADLDGACDHLLLLRHGRLGLSGGIEELLAGHSLLSGPRGEVERLLGSVRVVVRRDAGRQTSALVRGRLPDAAGPYSRAVSLDELVLGYLESPASPVVPEHEQVAV